MAVLDDTNLAHRGGLSGLRDAQRAAADYLRGGGAASDDGFGNARALHRDFVRRGASPGGSADLLAAACWLRRVV
jgi:triphosphoribosyl-dephospho-CoA synthase